jgi:hypothetical protein
MRVRRFPDGVGRRALLDHPGRQLAEDRCHALVVDAGGSAGAVER